MTAEDARAEQLRIIKYAPACCFPYRDDVAEGALDALAAAGWSVIRTGSVPPWIEETNARQNAAGSCIGGIADWSTYPDFDVKLYRLVPTEEGVEKVTEPNES